MGQAVIVGNAPLHWNEALVATVRDASLVVAADGGANHLARIGVRPAAVVGDLDSILPGVRAWVGEDRILHRPDQDHTDLDKALAHVINDRGANQVTVLAATGGRLDHAMENLALLARWAARAEVALEDAESRIVAVHDEASLATTSGVTVSLVPLGRCERVWTSGLHWPLAGEPLALGERTGVSNRATGQRCHIKVEGGVLLVFLHHDHLR